MNNPRLNCSGPLSRRSFLQAGMVGLSGLGLSDLLRLRAQANTGNRALPDTAVILIWLPGGMSHIDTYDMKPNAPTEFRGDFRPVRTVVPGLDVCELMPEHAKVADRFSIVRSVSHIYPQHGGGTKQMLMGRPPLRPDGDGANEYPVIGSVVSKMREGLVVGLPNYVLCTDEGTLTAPHQSAYLGPAHGPFQIGANFLTPEFKIQNLTLAKEMEGRLDRRLDMMRGFDALRRELDRSGGMTAMDQFSQMAADMLTSDRARSAFDLAKEPDPIRNMYGRHAWGNRALLARRLVEAGVSFVTVEMSNPWPGRTAPAETHFNWDTHSVNSNHFKDSRWKLPDYDQSVAALIKDIYARGLDKKVMLVVTGEFGRTPYVEYEKPGRPGRGHHCNAMSILLAGGGLRTGQVVGATDAKADHPVDRPLTSADLWATVYRFLGIDAGHCFIDTIGRPIAILPSGEPIRELLST
jgi:hypothetical protein